MEFPFFIYYFFCSLVRSFFVVFFFQINLSFIFCFLRMYSRSDAIALSFCLVPQRLCVVCCLLVYVASININRQSPLMHVFVGHTSAHARRALGVVRISMIWLLALTSTSIKVSPVTWILSYLPLDGRGRARDRPSALQSCHHKSPSIFASFVISIHFVSFVLPHNQ